MHQKIIKEYQANFKNIKKYQTKEANNLGMIQLLDNRWLLKQNKNQIQRRNLSKNDNKNKSINKNKFKRL